MIEIPKPQLSGAIVHEREQDWPDELRIIAKVGKRTYSETISKDQFFGAKQYGAPMSGDQVLQIINRLRRKKA